MPERVSIETADGVSLIGDWYEGPAGAPVALLLHMMPADRTSWRNFSGFLLAADWSALAIDLRGHGESTVSSGGPLDYRSFTDEDHQASMGDLEAAIRWLEARGVAKTRIALVGASIGANLSIAYASEHVAIPAVAALSPGLDYRGITTDDKVARFRVGQSLLLAASAADERSAVCVRSLKERKADATALEFQDAGHGTDMLERAPGLIDDLVGWLKTAIAE